MNGDDRQGDVADGLEAVLITEELGRRSARSPDYEAENRALTALAQELASNPGGVLQKVSELVLELTHADSAGISILESGDIFRWYAAAGAVASKLNGTIPKDASPCGVVVARDALLLVNEAERAFPALRGVEPRSFENLLVPWHYQGKPIGTLWAIAHSPERRFDAEDARSLESLARFAAAAHQLSTALEKAESRGRELEELRRSEQRFTQAFFTAPFAAALTTLDEDRFVEVNDAFCSLTGYRRDEVLGRSALELGMWSSLEDQRKLEESMNGGGVHDLDLHLQTKDGDSRSIAMSIAVVPDSAGQVLLKMFYDMTARMRTEEQLIKAIEEVMQDTAWFARAVVEKLAQLRSGQTDAPAVAELTPREQQVLALIGKGMNNKQIAAELGLSPQTVRNYTASLYGKLELHSRAEAVVWARERGLA